VSRGGRETRGRVTFVKKESKISWSDAELNLRIALEVDRVRDAAEGGGKNLSKRGGRQACFAPGGHERLAPSKNRGRRKFIASLLTLRESAVTQGRRRKRRVRRSPGRLISSRKGFER